MSVSVCLFTCYSNEVAQVSPCAPLHVPLWFWFSWFQNVNALSMCLQVKAQDIVGSMKADKQNLRMEELDLLFQTPSFSATA